MHILNDTEKGVCSISEPMESLCHCRMFSWSMHAHGDQEYDMIACFKKTIFPCFQMQIMLLQQPVLFLLYLHVRNSINNILLSKHSLKQSWQDQELSSPLIQTYIYLKQHGLALRRGHIPAQNGQGLKLLRFHYGPRKTLAVY